MEFHWSFIYYPFINSLELQQFKVKFEVIDLFTYTAAILNNLSLQNIMGFPRGKQTCIAVRDMYISCAIKLFTFLVQR